MTPLRRKKKFHVFGKSSWDSPAIISSCLDVNVSTNSATDELSVYKNQCYKRLIKLKRAADHLQEVKQRSKGIFKGDGCPRAKRLFNKAENRENLWGEERCVTTLKNEENRGRNRHNVEWFLYTYYISAGETSLLQVQ